jgi:hypothetical protein
MQVSGADYLKMSAAPLSAAQHVIVHALPTTHSLKLLKRY